MNPLIEPKILDATKLSCYKQCPRLFLFNYILCWQSKRKSHHLTFGASFHDALEAMWSDYPDLTLTTLDKAVAVFNKSLEQDADPDQDWKEKTPINAEIALKEYAITYRDDWKRFKPVMLEKAGQVPINMDLDLLTVKIDKIMQDVQTGLYYVIEHKTAGQKPKDIYNTRLQITGYYHAMNMAYGHENVGGVLVDVITFLKPSTPAAKKRIASGGTAMGFERFLVKKDHSTMKDGLAQINYWHKAVLNSYKELIKTGDATYFPKNDDSCYAWGRICPFYPICSLGIDPLKLHMPIDYEVREWNPLAKYDQVEFTKT